MRFRRRSATSVTRRTVFAAALQAGSALRRLAGSLQSQTDPLTLISPLSRSIQLRCSRSEKRNCPGFGRDGLDRISPVDMLLQGQCHLIARLFIVG